MVADPERLYAPRRVVTRLEDCLFYHVMELPGYGEVGGQWDLRGREQEYLGGVDVRGRRVLEVAAASGFLTRHLESAGGTVVAHELAPEEQWDLVPQQGLDFDQIRADRANVMERLRNSFALVHRLFGLSAEVHYGNAYTLPDDLGRFDVATLAAVLLHTRDPLRVLERCARLVDDTLVIVERHRPELEGPLCRLEPSPENDLWDTWWTLTPVLVVQFAGVLGFPHTDVTFHEQAYPPEPDVPETTPVGLFTVVAHRG